MNLGEKFADAWFNYREKTDEETLPSLLSEDFQWETITKTRINDKIFESKQDTLNTLSAIKAKATKSIFYSSDEMLVFATNFILESENLNRAILFSVIFKDSFIDTPRLQIPHPGSLLRKFVLIPLAELAPNDIFPKTNIKIVDLLKKCPDTSVVQKYVIDKKA